MEHKLWINGEWQDTQGGSRMSIEDPTTGKEIAEVINASREDVDRAVQAARRAFYDGRWSKKSPGERSKIIWKLADLLEANAESLAKIESDNTGKPYQYVSLGGDIPFAVDNLRFFAGAARDTHGSHAGEFMAGYTSMYRREPVGVVGQIAPWNFPLVMAAWKLGPALAAGCTCILKPAEQTPLTALRVGDLIIEAGFPPGVVNILTGYGENVGAALVTHPGVDKIAFTGSTLVGKSINKAATDTLKRVSLELGGKSPVIVLPDADVDTVIGGAAGAIFFNAGQVCAAGSRLYVHRKIFDRVVEGVGGAAQSIRLGPGLDPATRMGPLVSREQQERVMGYIKSGRDEGASVVAGGDT